MGSRINLTPEELINEWDEFKRHIDANPDKIESATNKGIVTLTVRQPYTKQGFFSFIYRKYQFHIHQYFDNYKNAYDSYLGVVTCIRGEWEQDQISGSLTGRYKSPNLVARLNNIKEQVDTTITQSVSILNIDPLDDSADNGTKKDSEPPKTD